MANFIVAYIPIGVPTYDMEAAGAQFAKSVEVIKKITDECVYPDAPLLSVDDLKQFIKDLAPDLILLQNCTFANGAYAAEIARHHSCPILLWTLREPEAGGGRLKLNSLTGAFSASNTLHNLGRGKFGFVYGGPDEVDVQLAISATIRVAKLVKELKGINIAAIGHTPPGFGFGRALDADIARHFGSRLESIEVRELMNLANSYAADDVSCELDEANKLLVGLDDIPKSNVTAFIRLLKAYKETIKNKDIRIVASRCWPDFFTEYGTPVCAVLSILNEMKIPTSCEADVYGAISMFIGQELSCTPTYFGDPVALSEAENTITFWHCGMAACSLAREDEGTKVSVHPNRRIGPTMEFGCRPTQKATLFRIGRITDGTLRLLLIKGEVQDEPKKFCGTSLVFKPGCDAKNLVEQTISAGWEPHFVVIYADVTRELAILARELDIAIWDHVN